MVDTSLPTHGLSNGTGENNCFINSVIQVLWHLEIFRNQLVLAEDEELEHEHTEDKSCLYCTLHGLFINFKYSDVETLPPTHVRNALADLFSAKSRFQLGEMDSALECYEAVVDHLSRKQGIKIFEDIFTYQTCESTYCECGAISEPFLNTGVVFYINADKLIELKKRNYSRFFGSLVRQCLAQDKRPCPDNDELCKGDARVRTILMKRPNVVNIAVTYATATPSRKEVEDLLNALSTELNLAKMFDTHFDNDKEEKPLENVKYSLVGIISYYGRHYTAYVYHSRKRSWMYCDDHKFGEVGSWKDVVKRFKLGKTQPEVLIFSDAKSATG